MYRRWIKRLADLTAVGKRRIDVDTGPRPADAHLDDAVPDQARQLGL